MGLWNNFQSPQVGLPIKPLVEYSSKILRELRNLKIFLVDVEFRFIIILGWESISS